MITSASRPAYQSVNLQRMGIRLAMTVPDQLVAGTSDGHDALDRVGIIQPAAQRPNMDIDHVGKSRNELVIPDMLGDHHPGENAVRMPHQVLEDAELFVWDGVLTVPSPGLPGRRIEPEITDGQDRGECFDRAAAQRP